MNQEDKYGEEGAEAPPEHAPLRRCEEHEIIECRQCFYVAPEMKADGLYTCKYCGTDCDAHRPRPK